MPRHVKDHRIGLVQGDLDAHARAEKRNRIYVVCAVLPGLFALTLGVFRSMWPHSDIYLGNNRYLPMAFIVVVLMLVSITGFVVLYLQTGFVKGAELRPASGEPDHVTEASFPNDSDGNSEQQPVSSEIADSRRTTVAFATEASREDERFRDISRYADEMIGRLSKAVEEQGRRNNINLGFGFFITLVGISVLVYFVQQHHDIDPSKPWSMLNFVPRLSLVVLVELFAYFFLGLYRNGLAEVKYLQNELINVRIRTLGLRTVIRENDKEGTRHIAKAFGDTDRNIARLATPAAPESPEILKTAQEIVKLASKLTGGATVNKVE